MRLRLPRRLLLVALIAAVSIAILRSCGASSVPVYWGAEIGQGSLSMSGVEAFRQLVSKAPAILPFNMPFIGCDSGPCSWYWFPTSQMAEIRRYGAIPMLNWSSMASPLAVNEPAFTLARVIRGDFDSYIRSFALGARTWGQPFFLRFNWEMNGNWFPWAEAANGNQPGQSAAAWRHVHDIFASVGATNVTWVWCPSITTTNATTDLRELYPGDSYVDWTCLDGYNWGTKAHGPSGWNTFNQVFSATYNLITTKIAPSKPMLIGEVASSENGGSKAAWIADMFKALPARYPKIRGLLWFDVNAGVDWPIETSQASTRSFSQGIANPRYLRNAYGSLPGGPINPP